jgi:hypothetical protein
MANETVTYPQYRKYKNNKSYFKIISPELFEEIQLLGSKKTLHFFEAKILPDRNYIKDLTFNYEKHWIVCPKSEYEELRTANYA